jgi:integrase/recombinase XerD
LHLEAQTVDEMLEGWRNQQLCGDLDHGTIAGALLDVLAAIKRCHDRSATNSPAHVSSRTHHACT